MLQLQEKKICDACKGQNPKLIKGMCKHMYERQRYENNQKFSELRRQKTVVNQALQYISSKCTDDSVSLTEMIKLFHQTLDKCELLFQALTTPATHKKEG